MSDGTYPRPPRPFAPRAPDVRASDSSPRPDARQHADPLQELARLIGQSDPYGPAQSRDPARSAFPAPPPAERASPRLEPRDYRQDNQDRHDYVARSHASHPAGTRPADEDDGYEADAEHGEEAEYAADGEYLGEYSEDDYDDGAEGDYDDGAADRYGEEDGGPKRHNGAKLALAVLGLAVFGTAAAFGYRSLVKPSVPGAPAVIHAAATPDKIYPADAGSKPINERLTDGTPERMVRRDEDPVEIGRGGSTGAVVPGTGGAFPAVSGYPTAQGSAPAATTEPKRVRTVTIRSDQSMTTPPSLPQTRASRGSASLAASQGAGAPLAITPQTTQAVAAVDTAAPPQPRTPQAAGGGYVVQISAQKSEAEAQAAYRAAQAKYTVLSGQQPLIRRKDQGEKGVFYAAQVGPFGSRDEATQLCESLKSAGGSCFVARN